MPSRDRPQTRKCFLLLNYPPFKHRLPSLSPSRSVLSRLDCQFGEKMKSGERSEHSLNTSLPPSPLQPCRDTFLINLSVTSHAPYAITKPPRSEALKRLKEKGDPLLKTNKNKNINQTKTKLKIANLPRIKIKTYVKSPSVLQTFFSCR